MDYGIMELCRCCICTFANGECCGEKHDPNCEPLSDLAELGWLIIGWDNDCEEFFSSRKCEGCGALPGDRQDCSVEAISA